MKILHQDVPDSGRLSTGVVVHSPGKIISFANCVQVHLSNISMYFMYMY